MGQIHVGFLPPHDPMPAPANQTWWEGGDLWVRKPDGSRKRWRRNDNGFHLVERLP